MRCNSSRSPLRAMPRMKPPGFHIRARGSAQRASVISAQKMLFLAIRCTVGRDGGREVVRGLANFVAERALPSRRVDVGGVELVVADGHRASPGASVTLALRPQSIRLSTREGMFRGTVSRAIFLGSLAQYVVDIAGVGLGVIDEPSPAEAGLPQTTRVLP